ncbi:MAG: hypothetical protein KQH57_18575 [Actinomycetales bacterium]|nr:hypothetical protein [Actinomycetales bacterium]
MTELDDDAREARTRITLRDHDQLRRTLRRVATEGWNGELGVVLMDFARHDVVRPMVIAMGVRGAAAGDAEAAAWAAAWEVLRDPRLLDAGEPWGVVRAAARHAIFGELIAARYACGARRGWRIWAQARKTGRSPEVEPAGDLLTLLEDQVAADPTYELLDEVLPPVRRRLIGLGWSREVLDAVIDAIVDGRLGVEPDGACAGWRPLSAHLDLPPWQVRRLTLALLGGPCWPGLLQRVIRDGVTALDSADCLAALRTTVVRRMRSPESEAPAALEREQARSEAA